MPGESLCLALTPVSLLSPFPFHALLLLIPASALPSMGLHGFLGVARLYFLMPGSSWIGICSSPSCPLPHYTPFPHHAPPHMLSCHPLIFFLVSHLPVCTLTTLETSYGWESSVGPDSSSHRAHLTLSGQDGE